MSEVEWRDLCALVHRIRNEVPSYEASIREQLGRTTTNSASDTWHRRVLEDLQQRLADIELDLYSNELRWDDAIRRIETTLPVGSGRVAVVESRIVPGPALGSRFAEGYPAGGRDNRYCGARYSHVPDLAQSVLTDARGQILYSGLRHGFLDVAELDSRLLAGVSNDELQALVGDLLMEGEQLTRDCDLRARLIDAWSVSIQCDPQLAARSEAMMVNQARRNMALELAAAALVADPEKLQRGLDGQPVDLDLYCVSVLAPDEFTPWSAQAGALIDLCEQGPVTLPVCGQDGESHPVRANVKVRCFVLSTTGERVWSTIPGFVPTNDACALLGQRESGDLGSEVHARIDAMQGEVSALRDQVSGLERKHRRASRTRVETDPVVAVSGSGLSNARERLRVIERNVCTLREAARQLQSMWAPLGDWPEQADAFKPAAARLALMAHLMGGTPVLSCASGSDLGRQLDPEVKFLATAAANNGGHLPPVGENLEAWQRARDAFRPQ